MKFACRFDENFPVPRIRVLCTLDAVLVGCEAGNLRETTCFYAQSDSVVNASTIAGVVAYGVRKQAKDPTNPIEWTEQFYAAETGCTPVKRVTRFRNSSQLVREASRIDLK